MDPDIHISDRSPNDILLKILYIFLLGHFWTPEIGFLVKICQVCLYQNVKQKKKCVHSPLGFLWPQDFIFPRTVGSIKASTWNIRC